MYVKAPNYRSMGSDDDGAVESDNEHLYEHRYVPSDEEGRALLDVCS